MKTALKASYALAVCAAVAFTAPAHATVTFGSVSSASEAVAGTEAQAKEAAEYASKNKLTKKVQNPGLSTAVSVTSQKNSSTFTTDSQIFDSSDGQFLFTGSDVANGTKKNPAAAWGSGEGTYTFTTDGWVGLTLTGLFNNNTGGFGYYDIDGMSGDFSGTDPVVLELAAGTYTLTVGDYQPDFVTSSGPKTTGGAYDLVTFGLTPNSGPDTGVPEPATWALMLVGFGMIGYALRKRANVTYKFA